MYGEVNRNHKLIKTYGRKLGCIDMGTCHILVSAGKWAKNKVM
jgi:hypothetical protein